MGDMAYRECGDVVLVLSSAGQYGEFELILHDENMKWVPRKSLKRLDM